MQLRSCPPGCRASIIHRPLPADIDARSRPEEVHRPHRHRRAPGRTHCAGRGTGCATLDAGIALACQVAGCDAGRVASELLIAALTTPRCHGRVGHNQPSGAQCIWYAECNLPRRCRATRRARLRRVAWLRWSPIYHVETYADVWCLTPASTIAPDLLSQPIPRGTKRGRSPDANGLHGQESGLGTSRTLNKHA